MSTRCLVLLCLFLDLALFCLLEQRFQHILLGQLLKELEDHWHIVVPPPFVLRLPIHFPLLLTVNHLVLHLEGLDHFGLACFQVVVRLGSQLLDFLLADLVLSKIS